MLCNNLKREWSSKLGYTRRFSRFPQTLGGPVLRGDSALVQDVVLIWAGKYRLNSFFAYFYERTRNMLSCISFVYAGHTSRLNKRAKMTLKTPLLV